MLLCPDPFFLPCSLFLSSCLQPHWLINSEGGDLGEMFQFSVFSICTLWVNNPGFSHLESLLFRSPKIIGYTCALENSSPSTDGGQLLTSKGSCFLGFGCHNGMDRRAVSEEGVELSWILFFFSRKKTLLFYLKRPLCTGVWKS